MNRLVLAAGAFSMIAFGANAFDNDDQRLVERTVNEFLAEFESQDWDAYSLPPSLLAHIAYRQNSTPEKLQASMAAQMRQMMDKIVIEDVDVEWQKIVTGDTATGESYAFLPFRSRFRLENGQSHETVSVNIVTKVDAEWHVVRIGTKQLWAMFQAAYPAFRDVDFPK